MKRRPTGPDSNRAHDRRQVRRRPGLEALEARRLLALLVNTTADSGAGSLRAAIVLANSGTAGPINFAINGATPNVVQTITLSSPLPAVIAPGLTIDGTSETFYAGTPLIQLDGHSAGANADGLDLEANGIIVQGLTIDRFSGAGINIQTVGNNVGAGDTILASWIGVSKSGTGTTSGNLYGIQASNSSGDTIGGTAAGNGNVISGNTQFGILIQNSNNLLIQGNNIGPDVSGTTAAGNGYDGIFLSGGTSNTIGGSDATGRNIISGNGTANVAGSNNGIDIAQPSIAASNNVIESNSIGITSAGDALGNRGSGVYIRGGANGVTVGGTVSGAGNFISGNGVDGITLQGSSTSPVVLTTIQGNRIGLGGAAGNSAVPNSGSGITAFDASSTTIGSANSQGSNVISGNGAAGIMLGSSPGKTESDISIVGNLIGTDATGGIPVGNQYGILLEPGSTLSRLLIGGGAAGTANVISGNLLDGINLSKGSNDSTIIRGDLIGTDSTGQSAVPNGGNGVDISHATNIQVGGGSGQGNVISGNLGDGILDDVPASAPNSATIQGNVIGLNAGGSSPIGNGLNGIDLEVTAVGAIPGAPNVIIGGTAANVGNVISANGGSGILETANGSGPGLIIQGNSIGTDSTGTLNLGNARSGIDLGGELATIGGLVAGAGNTIAFNGGTSTTASGVHLTATAQFDTIEGNSIFRNAGTGLLFDPGANGDQPAPQILSSVINNNTTTVDGNLTGVAPGTYHLEFFSNIATGAGGVGQGQTFEPVLGSADVVVPAASNSVLFSITLNRAVPVGQFITATATSAVGNTSPFSNANVVSAVANLGITITGVPTPSVLAGQQLTYTVTVTDNGPSPAAGVVVVDTLPISGATLFGTPTADLPFTVDTTSVPGEVIVSLSSTLSAGTSFNVTIVVVAANGPLVDHAEVFATTPPDTMNNPVIATPLTTDVITSADVAVSLLSANASVVAGSPVSYTLTVANSGPSTATNVVASNAFQAGVAYVPNSAMIASGAPGTITYDPSGNGTLNVSIPSLPVGTPVVVTFQAIPSPSVVPAGGQDGTISDIASVTSDTTNVNPNPTFTLTTTVTPLVNLTVVASTVPAGSVLADQPLIYNFLVTNTGPNDALGVTFTDVLPTGVVYQGGSSFYADGVTPAGSYNESNGTVSVSLGGTPLLAGQSFTVSITVIPQLSDPTISAPVPLSNTGVASLGGSDDTDLNPAPMDTVTVSIVPAADLQVSQSIPGGPFLAGQSLQIRGAVFNAGPSNAQTLFVYDQLPAGTVFDPANSSSGIGATYTPLAGNIVRVSFITGLPVGTKDSFSIGLKSNVAGDLVNVLSADSELTNPVPADSVSILPFTVTPAADLAVTQAVSPINPVVGQQITDTITVANLAGTVATGAMLTDVLPAGLTLVSAASDLGALTSTAGSVTVDFSGLPGGGLVSGGQVATITLVLQGTAAGTFTNVATAMSQATDPVPGNNVSSAPIAIAPSADVGVTVASSGDPAHIGTNLVYTIVVTNSGPSPATGVVLTDTFSQTLGFVSAAATQGTAQLATTPGLPTVVANLGTIGVNASATVTITVLANAVGPISNTATVKSTVASDTNPANNTATLVGSVVATYGTLAFSSPTYTAIPGPSTATITVLRVGGSDGSVTVNYATAAGSATPSVNYLTASGTLTFGPGVTSLTFPVSILGNVTAAGGASFALVLSSPTGGAALGGTATSTLTIAPGGPLSPPPGDTGPTVTGYVIDTPAKKGNSRVILSFSSALDPTSAQLTSNYSLVSAGVNSVFGTKTQQTFSILSATYDPATHQVTLVLNGRFNASYTYRLTVNGASPSGVKDIFGVYLDGTSKGTPGTNYVIQTPESGNFARHWLQYLRNHAARARRGR